MGVPPSSNSRWKEIVTGKKTYTLKFLAAKILLGRLMRNVKADGSADNVSKAVAELHAIYTKNADNASAKEDLQTMFG
ncbi:hypothetical protein [Maridesulfovibrio sp.]|uniref:hypothetical protein n=1 Tax=Maridesulfovibrio sp. TaxID=2795000 RepID=UPI0029C9D498|nr:hypothetical protein [Maridesulfovibrio sp.]